MFSKLTYFLNQVFQILRIEKNHLPVFTFLLVLSTLFWLLTVLSKEYTTTVHYTAKFVELPDDKLLINNEMVDLHLQVIAPGFALLAHKLSFRKELPLSVNSFISRKKSDQWNYYLFGEQSISQIQEVLPTNIQLLHIQPNRIDVFLDEKAERVIPIKLKSELEYLDLFRLKEEVLLEPSTVIISGPKAVVEVFDEINTRLLKIEAINSNLSGKIELEPLNHSEINYTSTVVDWSLKVEQFTEGELMVKPKINNIPKGYDIKLFPEQITINYLVSLDNFELVKSNMFDLSISFNQNNKRQLIDLNRQPDFVENIRLNPEKVEYYLIKK